ncbi:hypothetical protein [Duganella sp. CF458]|uniref:hypothetical protein n=1 Tax=Duganella sp. CF458 TaxID=1884368 RepID=UPI0011132D9F|nr:hypothetical protein [Duganella sp. CF458]
MERPHIEQVPGLWECDGSLRDVYFFGADIDRWSRFLEFALTHRFTYMTDGEAAEFPGIEEVFRAREVAHCFSIWIGDACANCHFFVTDEIELDLDPREVLGQNEHEALLAFVEAAANVVGLDCAITPEGTEGSPFLSFSFYDQRWKIHG